MKANEPLMLDLQHAIRCYGSQKAVAKLAKISPQFLHDVLKNRREPSGNLLRFFGYERVTIYRKRRKTP